ncbi:MAG: MlaD family protein [Desulfobacteraceae bacterium]|jgi:phospholipid/cholesterol/gamma-HCH transport system substrate-binding protein
MASQKAKFSVGLFMLGGVGIALAGIVWIGMTSLFQEGERYVTYFNESVQGLDVDSPVKYRGVSVGRVEKIGVAPDDKLIEVVLKIESGQSLEEEGIVAQLKNVGITGLMFVELDQQEPGEAVRSPKLDFYTTHKVLPSKPSDISELLKGIDDVIKKFKTLDIQGISDKLKGTLDKAMDALGNVEKAVVDAEVKSISEGIQRTLSDINQILDPDRWNRIILSTEGAVDAVNQVLQDAGQTVNAAGGAVERVDGIVRDKRQTIVSALDGFERAMVNANRFLEQGTRLAGNADASVVELRRYLVYTAQHLERAAENLTRLTETLADQPSELLFGEPPPRREIEPER